jgi:hypothetical protein
MKRHPWLRVPAIALAGCLLVGSAEGRQSQGPAETLAQAREVDDALIGFSGDRSPLYEAFASLYARGPDAIDEARRLIEKGTPAARVYGYLLLRHASKGEADGWRQRLGDDRRGVVVLSGCIERLGRVGDLIREIDDGKQVIVLPEEASGRGAVVERAPEY